ncbi:FtsW/RodA/SpoVE family cell cycle protein [Cryobacterium sp. 10I1]|uniref:FtsW/RodA/SpoVE family cell cycle protein n=1 Tax=Cryobacterium sp. 10S3 TaxID=3048582 RepID=UPI002AB4F65E|nr:MULTISPECIES: FtsW/RodA/SpoVE family cell cycle protein [unclassified Cryobacterium]MDY7526323.1 FtsW/RodA/SpoVE family cell cycle protein [Cryobacterium sp. 10C2]MDY7557872.1 FtsW/RodA/SpoVE family cell cycle protein [Cryobacterium sp. 10C3]MEB0004448.1 FtsW/RodA/SpoVE family cell cycle protein [Cryobacterium sp. RTC2.1]MEB0203641.1 FtsW/RodA/SpoVE family cell cycle protein [Cryobacterium sp. 5I3]MEB0288582.1 FtsW/RodA/SpoVE family cell cycle protein [Cryobacterium sp. 10S3]
MRRIFHALPTNYFLLLGTTVFLVVFGMAMVLSSSSVDSYLSGGGFFGVLLHQGFVALVGIPLMLLVSRAPLKFWRRIAWPALILTCFVQCLVFTPLGVTVAGNTNWLSVGSFQFQPSEAIKVALAIWLGTILAHKQNQLDDWRHVLIPVLGVGGTAVMLVMIRGDLGTTVIMAGMLFGSLFFAGVRLRMLAIPLGIGAVGAIAAAAGSANRLTRILSFFGTGCDTTTGTISASCWQPLHGTWALANGGVLGVGLGNSKAKWSWLPAADNDYIFAIIGEELGLIGAVAVLLLFVLLAVGFIRIMSATTHLQAKVSTATVMVWIIGQALVNIGVVLGFIPVLGVPLPFISAGGTALLTTLVAIGVVLSFARNGQNTRVSDKLHTSPAIRPAGS